jgi:hypothetical protein
VFKRIMLTLTFAAAFGAAGLCLTDNVEARRWRGASYYSYYYGPYGARVYDNYGGPYRTYYRGYYGAYSSSYYDYPYSYYGYPSYYDYRPEPRVSVQVGPVWR